MNLFWHYRMSQSFTSPSHSIDEGSDSGYKSISSINLYNPTKENIVDAVLDHLNLLGGGEGDLPPFVSVTKLKCGRIYTVKKVVMRIEGIDHAPFSGIHLFLDNCRTSLPSKDEFDLICLIVIKIMRSSFSYRAYRGASNG